MLCRLIGKKARQIVGVDGQRQMQKLACAKPENYHRSGDREYPGPTPCLGGGVKDQFA